MDVKENKEYKNKGLALGGAGAIGASKNMILGKKTMYHGTSKGNWDNIKNEGLRFDKGGINGASQAINDADYIKSSTNKVHATRFGHIANLYSNLNEKDMPILFEGSKLQKKQDSYLKTDTYGSKSIRTNDPNYEKYKQVAKDYSDFRKNNKSKSNKEILKAFLKPGHDGKRIKMSLDYDKFKKMEIDPDQSGLPSSNKLLKSFQRNIASRGSINVSPEEIHGSNAKMIDRFKHTTKMLPGYIKNNPLRFGSGLAMAGAGMYAMNKGINNKEAFMHYKGEIEKIAKTMPFKSQDGSWAIPRTMDSPSDNQNDDIEGKWQNDYFRKEHKIPNHYKRIADDGMGNSTFVDTTSDPNNPDFYDWDHETVKLSKLSDDWKKRYYSTVDDKVGNNLLGNNLLPNKIKSLSKNDLKEYGYSGLDKQDIKNHIKKSIKNIGIGGAIGAGSGLSLLSDFKNIKKSKMGAGIGGAIGVGVPAIAAIKSGLSLRSDKENKFKEQLKSSYYDSLFDREFTNQYNNKEAYMDYKREIEKVAESSMKDDFIAGVDPTGVRTFRNAMNNETKHSTHKLLGDLGGFAGGAVSGALIPAALTGAAALATKKKLPGLSKNLTNMSKGSLDAFNPKRVSKYTASLGKLSKFQGLGSQLMHKSNKIMNGADEAEKITSVLKNGGKLSESKIYAISRNKKISPNTTINDLRDLKNTNAKLQSLSDDLSKNYYNGKSVSEGGERALTSLTTLGTALGGGALNASSAHMQYNTGRSTKRMIDQDKAKEK